MSKERNALKAGAFIIGSIAVVVALVIAIKGTTAFQSSDRRTVEFALEDNIGGLRVGDEVRIGGAKVGDVHEIEVVQAAVGAATRPSAGGLIRVTFGVPKAYAIREGAKIGVETSVTGQSVLNFTSLGTGQPLAATTPLKGAPSGLAAAFTRVPELLASLQNETLPRVHGTIDDVRGQTIPRVNSTIESFKVTADSSTQLVKKVQGEIDPAVEKYNKVADNTAGMMGEIKDVFGDTKMDIRSTMSNVASATGSLKTSLPGILEKVDAAVVKVNTTLEKTTEAMEDVKAIAASSKSVIAGNKGKLDGMIASLKATSDNLKNATADIRRSPWRLLYRPSNKETSNLNIYDAARQFAEGANDLNDATQALRDALNSKTADGEQIKKLMSAMEESFKRFNDVEQKLWSEVKE